MTPRPRSVFGPKKRKLKPKVEGYDNSADLPPGQAWVFRSVSSGGGGNWSGTPQTSREALIKKGLIDFADPIRRRHTQWAKYKLTPYGGQVACAVRFDEGLKYGYEAWCRLIDHESAREAEAERQDVERDEVRRGLRYEPSESIDAEVKAVIWKHVKVTP